MGEEPVVSTPIPRISCLLKSPLSSAKVKASPKASEEPEAPKQAIKSDVVWKTSSKADELSRRIDEITQRMDIYSTIISEVENKFSDVDSNTFLSGFFTAEEKSTLDVLPLPFELMRPIS